jgi:hypothetical protein
MILKPDGTPLQIQGRDSYKSYRPNDTTDIDLFNTYDQDLLEVAGAPIIYYPCYIDTNYDSLYQESIDSIITQEGYQLFSYYQPVRPLQNLNVFGIDSNDELYFNFNIAKWKEVVGNMPLVKSLIFSVFDKTYWEIVQMDQEIPYRLWNKFRLQVHTKKYQISRSDKNPTRRDAGDNTIQIY